MKANSLGFQILGWAEIVISARALLFLAPVLISKWQMHSLSSGTPEDWFLWVATFAALFYFLIGIVSLAGHKLWRAFHVLAMLIVGLMTFGLWNIGTQQSISLPLSYFLPAGGAIMATVGGYFFKMNTPRG